MSDHENMLKFHENRSGYSSNDTLESNQTASLSNTRRTFLRGAAAAGLASVGLASNASASSSYTAYDDEYQSVVNVVEAGADNTGNEPITPVLESERSDNTLFYFPPGEYLMDSQFRFTGFEKFGVVGEDATLVPANYYDYDGPQFRLFRLGTDSSPGRDVRFEGFDVDQTAPDTGIRVIDTVASHDLVVRDIFVKGEHDAGCFGPARIDVNDPNGSGLVENFRAPYGGQWTIHTPHEGKTSARGPVGINANMTSGTLKFRRCVLAGFPGSGLYACGGPGTIIVHGGYYRNNESASLRIGGTNSEVRWPTIIVDETGYDSRSQRGIRVEHSEGTTIKGAAIRITSPMPTSHAISPLNSSTDTRIEDTTIKMSGDKINHGIVVSAGAGETTIVDTDITHETAGGYPIWIRQSDHPDRVICEYVTIDGKAGDAAGMRDGIRCGRNNSRFNVCDVSQPGKNGKKRNALVNTGDGNVVWHGTYRASQYPFVELGTDTSYRQSDAESTSGREAIIFYDESRDVRLYANRLANGIKDLGCDNLYVSSSNDLS